MMPHLSFYSCKRSIRLSPQSEKPSADAFEFLENMSSTSGISGQEVAADVLNYFKAQLDRAAESEIRMGPGAGVRNSHQARILSSRTSQASV